MQQLLVDPLRVEITTKACPIPQDEWARLQGRINELNETLVEIPEPALNLRVVFRPRREVYHAEFELRLPGRTLSVHQEDPYLDTVLQRCFDGLIREAGSYMRSPDREAVDSAERRAALHNDVIAPIDSGRILETINQGDYRAFRTLLANYEDWLRIRVGRLIQRHPEAQAKVGKGLWIGDVVEDVYLTAFEGFASRPARVPVGEWLESLIEPSIQELLLHPDEEREAVSLARTVRSIPE